MVDESPLFLYLVSNFSVLESRTEELLVGLSFRFLDLSFIILTYHIMYLITTSHYHFQVVHLCTHRMAAAPGRRAAATKHSAHPFIDYYEYYN